MEKEEAVYDFAAAHPASEQIPTQQLTNAMSIIMTNSGGGSATIGSDFTIQDLFGYSEHGGSSEARIELVKFLNRMSLMEYDSIMGAFQMFFTPGSSYSLQFITQLRKDISKCIWENSELNATKEKDIIIVEDPTYWLAKNIFEEDQNIELIAVRLEEDGIDLNELNQILIEKGKRVKMVYVISSYQNPTGFTLSESKKKDLVALSKKHEFFILDDQVYQLLTFSADHKCPTSILKFDYEPFTVITIGSFSKILSPGIRLGWIHSSHSDIISMFEGRPLFYSGGNLCSTLTVKMIEYMMITTALDKHILHIRQCYSAMCEFIYSKLREAFPDDSQVVFRKPEGGYYIWIRCIHPKLSNLSLCIKDLKQNKGVLIVKGTQCSIYGKTSSRFSNCLRICFVKETDYSKVETGISLLVSSLKQLMLQN